jgi:thiamine biosynthesis lipoprotein
MSHSRTIGFAFVAALALTTVWWMGCRKPVVSATESRSILGTTVTVAIYDQGIEPRELKSTFADVFAVADDWEKRTLAPGELNQVAQITKGSGVQSIPVDAAVFAMLMKALRLYDATGEAFDIRYGPMLDLWGFDGRPHVPTQVEIDTAKSLVRDGGMFVAGTSILLGKKGMRFDVREIAVGHAFDQMAARLAARGIRSAMISSPRVCRTMGDLPDRRGFKWTLADPSDPKKPWAAVWLPVGGAAYANVSVNRFTSGGKAYHSLLDPRTGYPGDRCEGAVVQASDAASAQGLAYGLFVLGSTDAFDKTGKAAVSGSLVVQQEGSRLKVAKSGSLADNFESVR